MMAAVMQNLPSVLELKYGPSEHQGPAPRLRQSFGYATPDDLYEAMVFSLVTPSTKWLDVGCGHSTFPRNQEGARVLADRCEVLVGIDPSENVHDNKIVHESRQCTIEEFSTDRQFDLITLRMVAEHIANPQAAVSALSRLTARNGSVVIYTVSKWSPAAIVAALTPLSFHHKAKKFLWDTEERDTFPTEYKMNTRRELSQLFSDAGFRETLFHRADDCRSFARFRSFEKAELLAWKALRSMGLRYPDSCILAVYQRI